MKIMKIPKLATLIAPLFILLIPAGLCLAETLHDGKQPMNLEILRQCVTDGIASTGREPTSDQIALLMETAAAESKCGMFNVPYKLKGSFGIFQITESTAKDTLAWLERSDARLWHDLLESCFNPAETLVDNLIFNPEFSASIAWLIYRRMGGKRLDISTREARAKAWKRIYNTIQGAGTESGYLRAARECLDAD